MSEPQYLLDAVSLIERYYARRLSLTVLAVHLNIPRTTLAAAFRRCRNTSAGAFIRAVRVRRATEILLTTNARIHEVAQQTGFYDQAHFVRTFRRFTGTTPVALRITATAARRIEDPESPASSPPSLHPSPSTWQRAESSTP